MVRLVEAPVKTPSSMGGYKKLDPQSYNQIIKLAAKMRGRVIIHINATFRGGGVAELLKTQIPFERFAGLDSRWLYIDAPRNFFRVTKKIHNLLQGKSGILAEKEKEMYLGVNRKLGRELILFLKRFDSAAVVIHDPQPLPLVKFIGAEHQPILRLHIDLSSPNPSTVEFLRPLISDYSLVVLSSRDYGLSLPWIDKSRFRIILPAIDPFTEKNKPMDMEQAKMILLGFGINPTKPTVTQVSRLDPWKDPLGVITAYYIAKKQIPELQLVLSGLFLANDDPEAVEMFKKVKKHARGDPDIFLFSDPKILKEVSVEHFLNALYTASTVIIQKSIREGFGLTVTEAMWKGKAVVAGLTSGTVLQIKNRKNGVLVSSVEEAAEAIIRLVKNPELREKLGKAARLSVRKKFLLPRLVKDHLRLYAFINKKSVSL